MSAPHAPAPAVEYSASVELTRELELRIAPIAAIERGGFTHLDLRLYRRIPDVHCTDAFQTVGGFRIPLRQVGEVVGKILAVAKAMERSHPHG